MDDSRFAVAAMAAKCRDAIRGSNEEDSRLPKALQPKHLLWMCEQIQKHAQTSSAARLQRWLGFVQAGILANRMLNLDQIKAMFDEIKKSHGVTSADHDLIDHLNVDNAFGIDLGGQG